MSWLGLAAVILALAVLVAAHWAAKSVDPFDWDDDKQDTKGA